MIATKYFTILLVYINLMLYICIIKIKTMEFKGTKGKWNYAIDSNKGFDVYLDNSIKIIAEVLFKDVSYMPNEKEAQANAKLITYAPEMFEMLKTVYLSFGGGNVITFSEKDIEDFEQLLTKITE